MNSRSDKFSSKIVKTPPSGIRKFFELIQGRDDIISLGVGEPDFATPWLMREEAYYHLEQGHTSYTSNWGLQELRDEIAVYMKRYGMNYDPKHEILITIGVSEAIDAVLRAVLNPGDEIIICEPCYVSYQPLAALCDTKLVHLDTSVNGFYPTAEQIETHITPHTKAVMLCSPSNPTGRVIPKKELEKIAEVVKKHQLWVLSDEVYCELVYDDNKHVSIGSLPGMKDYTITLNGFSKAFAMTGWRIGYVAGPAEIVDRMTKCQENFNACANAPGQYAGTIALDHPELCKELCQIFERRRDILLNGLSKINGIRCNQPTGAFYAFADISGFGLSSIDFCNRLLEEQKVVCIPGSAFGECGEGFIRIAYTCSEEDLSEALRRIECFCKTLT